MTPLVLAAGFSHLAALKEAFDKRKESSVDTLDVEFIFLFPAERYSPWFSLDRGSFIYNANIREDMISCIETRRPIAILASIWSNHHFDPCVSNNPRPFDFILPDEPNRDLSESAEIVLYDLVRAMMAERCALTSGLIGFFRSFTDIPIIVPSAPPAIANVLEIPAGTSSKELDAKVAEFGIAPPELRYKFWKLCESLFEVSCREGGATFLPAPRETICREGFRQSSFFGPDWLHANWTYGEFVLKQVESFLEEIR